MGIARQRSWSMLRLICLALAVLVPGQAALAQQTQTQPPITVLTRVIPVFNIGKPYRVQLQASGGTAPYSWRLVQGTLPDGVGLTTTGLLVGRPRGPSTSAIVVEVADSGTPPKTAQQPYDFSGALT